MSALNEIRERDRAWITRTPGMPPHDLHEVLHRLDLALKLIDEMSLALHESWYVEVIAARREIEA